ncbi:MAG TPA: hypothetical protein VJZ73_18395 [Methylomirabilota bacterium]|nr:hypothetical protein [Methylomirabilota bacterium]
MNSPRRSLCIVSRDPLQCSELVLALQAGVEPDDEIEIIMDRRRERALFDTSVAPGEPQPDRRRNPDVDLAVRTKGFAIVPATPWRREREETDPDADRARFGSILSFKRARQARPARVAGAAGAIVAALILTPPQSGPSDPVSGDERAPEMAPPHGAIPASRAERLRRLETPGASSSAAHTSGARPRMTQPGLLETYASRVEDATERLVSKAKQLFARSSSSSAADPSSAKPRAGHAP